MSRVTTIRTYLPLISRAIRAVGEYELGLRGVAWCRWVAGGQWAGILRWMHRSDELHSPYIHSCILGTAESARIERPVRGRWFQWLPSELEWNIAHLPIPGLPPALEGLRIIHLTDLHLRRRWRPIHDDLKRRLEESEPDLLLMTGDFVDSKRNHLPALPHLYRLLESFRGRLGCYAILGNHDRYGFERRLEGTSVRIIEYQRVILPIPGRAGHAPAAIELIGLPGVDRRDLTPHVVNSFPSRESAPPGVRIVLSHFPDHLRKIASLNPDVVLAGHTHGGQCCLPGMIPILRHAALPRRLCGGVHRVGNTWLVVSRGIGTTGLPLRVFCPPEVLEIRLERSVGD